MTILLLSLDKESDDAKLGPLLDSIRSVTTLELVETIAELRIALRRPNKPSAVLEIDGGISNPDNRDSLQLLIAFVTQGGILVCGGNFSDAHKGLDYLYATEFFSRWGLPWDAGSYLRTTVHLNPRPQTVAGIFIYGLSQSYSVKALSLVNVPAHQALYNPSSSSRIESRVFAPDRFPVDPKETPCAYAQVGRGYFGYVGDMNNEEASIRVIRAILRLPQSTALPSLNNPLRDGTQANQDQTDDIRYTDDIRQAGHGELEFGYRQGEEVGIVAFPADGGPPVPVLVPPQYAQLVYGRSRSRSPEVAARATKRAAVSTRKHEQSEALKEQGNEKFRQGDYRAAVAFYKRAIAVRGPQPTYQANLAAAYMKLEMLDEAEEACSEALKHDPKHLKARFRRGTARLHMYRFKDAIKDFKMCGKLDPSNSEFPAAILKARQTYADLRATGYKDQWENTVAGSQDLSSDEDSDDSDDEWANLDFEDRRLDDPLVIASESDSSDFVHEGNGTPCRDYNHDGCQRGTSCQFKHAPVKQKTTRDELGRNVCNFWLLDGCRFGDACAYAHSKEYLPESGWWTASENLDGMKDVMQELNRIRGYNVI